MSENGFLLSQFASCAGSINEESGEFEKRDVTGVAKCCLNFCEPQLSYCVNSCKNRSQKIYEKELDTDLQSKLENGKFIYNTSWGDRKLESGEVYGLQNNTKLLTERCIDSCKYSRDLCLGQCRLIDPLVNEYNVYNQCANKYTKDCKIKTPDTKNISELDDRGVNAPYKECVEGMEKEIYDCCVSGCNEKTDDTFDCDRYCTFLQNLVVAPDKVSKEYGEITDLFSDKNPVKPKKYKFYKDRTVIWVIIGILLGIIFSLIIVKLIK